MKHLHLIAANPHPHLIAANTHAHLIRLPLKRLLACALIAAMLAGGTLCHHTYRQHLRAQAQAESPFIRWVDFNPSSAALTLALELDIASHTDVAAGNSTISVNWIDLLAYTAAKLGGNFRHYKAYTMQDAYTKLRDGVPLSELTAKLKHFAYYQEAFTAVLGGLVGAFEEEAPDGAGGTHWQSRYGLMAFSPIAKGFPYQDYDDFGVNRSYGYERRHLGHDMMGQVGTPIVAVEGGTVEALGWNQYGGWRIGIRSADGKRYYYYAHLRRNYPYVKWLQEGGTVQAGDVIGYLGRTGYSKTENVNNIEEPHLHFGLQLIFDESQREGDGEIWVDVYALTQFLAQHRSAVAKEEGGKEYWRIYEIRG